MSEPTPEAIEAAAKAIEAQEKFGTVPRSVMIRAALSAAAPLLVAQAKADALAKVREVVAQHKGIDDWGVEYVYTRTLFEELEGKP